ERRKIGAERLPGKLEQALERLRGDQVLAEAMGDELLGAYLAVKQLDVEAFKAAGDDFEFREHIYKY
ncbi:MAG: glutamine synthetase, partial [Chloroflexi bacterium]